ncbi:hypothetical protein TWF481_010961 [Arthrobotrys musiformis]|uniref:Uncharacterized protein n=1 Tax=Arthrobotrys musiformis TaxID=47236 RepID=A0AAV9W303_9PEZI
MDNENKGLVDNIDAVLSQPGLHPAIVANLRELRKSASGGNTVATIETFHETKSQRQRVQDLLPPAKRQRLDNQKIGQQIKSSTSMMSLITRLNKQIEDTTLVAQAAGILDLAIGEILITVNGNSALPPIHALDYGQLTRTLEFEEVRFNNNNGTTLFELDEPTTMAIRLNPEQYPIYYRLLLGLDFLSLDHLHWNLVRAIKQVRNQRAHYRPPRSQFSFILERYASKLLTGEGSEKFKEMMADLSRIAARSKRAVQRG